MKLSSEQIESLDLPAELHDAVRSAKTMKSHGAIRRQLQFIGTLMRRIDHEPLQNALHLIRLGKSENDRKFKELEKWRDELITGNKMIFEEILNKHPYADRQKLSRLVRQAIKERQNESAPKFARSLFRYLREITKGTE